MQNIPSKSRLRELRACVVAPEGRVLVVADYSQIELRILAEFSGDRGFIEAFNSGADLHRVTAAQVSNVPLDQVSKDQRDFAKRLNFGVVYGIGAQRFSIMTGLSVPEAENVLRKYFATYRGLDNYLREAANRRPALAAAVVLGVIVVVLVASKGFHDVAQTGLNGLSLGAVYALGAVGLTLVWSGGVSLILFFAARIWR